MGISFDATRCGLGWAISPSKSNPSRNLRNELKRAGAELRALARGPGGRRFVGLGFAFPVFVLFSGHGGEVFEPVAPAGNGDSLGVVKLPSFPKKSFNPWTSNEEQLVGTMTDQNLARKIHRAISAVRLRRLKLGIHAYNPQRHNWTSADKQLLGQRPDDQVALLLGTTQKAVLHRRSLLRRPACPQQRQAALSQWSTEEDEIVRTQEITEAVHLLKRTRSAILNRRRTLGVCAIVRREWTPEQDQLFKRLNDREIAQKLGRTQSSVENRRTRLKIPVPKPGWRFFTAEEDALLGTDTDAVIAKRLGRHPSSVQARRLRLGLGKWKSRRRRPWSPEEDAILGTASDSEVASRLDRHIATVCLRRQKLGIPNFYWQQRCGRQRNI